MEAPSSRETILVVDDAPETLEVIRRNLEGHGHRVYTASSVPAALEILEKTPVDLVVTDLKMPRVSGLDLVRHIRENLEDTEVMMITGYPSVEGAVTAVKAGAEEYLAKPFTDEELLAAVRKALDNLALRCAGRAEAPPPEAARHGLLGESRSMQRVFQAIAKAAATHATVLITGASGTGKELVARAIHYAGPRAQAPFVPVNCGAIPEGLIESELFGHVRGAFTGASESRAGFFVTADGGTIFLDEVSELGLALQVKLLRVLEDGEVWMVGASRPRQVDVRILAATNKDLAALVERGKFREDLFFRLNVLAIDIAPLREREEDVLPLTRHFAEKFAGELGKPAPRFTQAALRAVRDHYWPGNVRELQNVVLRLVVMGEDDVVDVPDLPPSMRFAVGPHEGIARTLAEVEGDHIRNVLASVDGNKTRAAQILGIDRKTLREKLKLLDPDAS